MCGSTVVDIHATDSVEVNVNEYAMQESQKDGETVAFRESLRREMSSRANTQKTGSLYSYVVGRPVQGENDSRRTCGILANALNRRGGNWSVANEILGNKAADCILKDLTQGTELEIQVVRVVINSDFYLTLAHLGECEEAELSPVKLAHCIFQAVQKKSTQLAPDARHGLVLAVDATRVSVYAMPAVINQFRERFVGSTLEQGFREVWLVGPTDTMTYRLDSLDGG